MEIQVEHLSKKYHGKIILDDINLLFPKGKLITVVGPSGCGKTTLLRSLAGFVQVDRGKIFFGGEDITHLPPQTRGTAMVFQNYALWPHMTVYENIAYGLKIRKISRKEIESRVKEILMKLEIDPDEAMKKHPPQYSGGQQQRIALARALVLMPKLLLLDEPLSNLDAKVREKLRIEIRRLQKEYGITTIYVTHDQEEALSMADQIVVMNKGKIEQTGEPKELYLKPQSYFVAQFLGHTNHLRLNDDGGDLYLGTQKLTKLTLPDSLRHKQDGEYLLLFKSEDARVASVGINPEGMLTLRGIIKETLFVGKGYRHWIHLEGQNIYLYSEQEFKMGENVSVSIPIERLFLYPGNEMGDNL